MLRKDVLQLVSYIKKISMKHNNSTIFYHEDALFFKKKHRREFKLSLHGWMEFRIAAVDLSTGDIATNRSGKDLGKSLSGLVAREIQKFKLRRGET